MVSIFFGYLTHLLPQCQGWTSQENILICLIDDNDKDSKMIEMCQNYSKICKFCPKKFQKIQILSKKQQKPFNLLHHLEKHGRPVASRKQTHVRRDSDDISQAIGYLNVRRRRIPRKCGVRIENGLRRSNGPQYIKCHVCLKYMSVST